MAEKDMEIKIVHAGGSGETAAPSGTDRGKSDRESTQRVQTESALIQIQEQIKQNAASVNATEMVNMQTELDFLVKVINDGLDAIEQLGAQPKDLDLGWWTSRHSGRQGSPCFAGSTAKTQSVITTRMTRASAAENP